MISNQETFRSFSYEDEAATARWYKEDVDKAGWRVIQDVPGSKSWIKTFPEMEVPIKVVIQRHLPISAEQFVETYSPENMKFRQKWDKAFLDNDVLEEYPDNGGYVVTNRIKTPWPLADRDFVLFFPPAKEIEWFGKRALFAPCVNAWHPLKPANTSGFVRATNGGNFYIAVPDEMHPENACTVFALSHNNFNGWLPKRNIEWLLSRSVLAAFIHFFDDIVEGSKMLSKNQT